MQVHSATQASTFSAAALGFGAPPPAKQPAGIQMALAKGEELFSEGEEAEYFYQVLSGTIRTCKLLSNGRRQIDAFHLRGDIFGLEAGAEHRFSAEAVSDATVIAFRRSGLTSLRQEDPALNDRIMSATLRNLGRAQDHVLLLGRRSADEKIATFLLDMAQRIPGQSGSFELPMQRSDIADHLGLTIETVSRTFTRLARSGFIKLSSTSRCIGLCNKPALERLNA
jgi:CRP/FNR family nitrogen fixation transcriptional regulator